MSYLGSSSLFTLLPFEIVKSIKKKGGYLMGHQQISLHSITSCYQGGIQPFKSHPNQYSWVYLRGSASPQASGPHRLHRLLIIVWPKLTCTLFTPMARTAGCLPGHAYVLNTWQLSQKILIETFIQWFFNQKYFLCRFKEWMDSRPSALAAIFPQLGSLVWHGKTFVIFLDKVLNPHIIVNLTQGVQCNGKGVWTPSN